MLTIVIPPIEGFDDETNQFVDIGEPVTLQLEHSLASLQAWESKWKVPFLSKTEKKTSEQTLDYVRCMILTQNVSDEVLQRLTKQNSEQIGNYIDESMTATWFSDKNAPSKPTGEIITAEIIYHWMVSLNIPFECQYWHLSRLLTLIKVCSLKNAPEKKMPPRSAAARQRSLNAARRKQHHTRG